MFYWLVLCIIILVDLQDCVGSRFKYLNNKCLAMYNVVESATIENRTTEA